MIVNRAEEIFEIRCREDKEAGYKPGERFRIVGERCSFIGFEDLAFAVDGRICPADVPWDDGDGSEYFQMVWIVTELSTGFQVCQQKDTKEEALAEAQKVLDLKGREAVKKAIGKALEMIATW